MQFVFPRSCATSFKYSQLLPICHGFLPSPVAYYLKWRDICKSFRRLSVQALRVAPQSRTEVRDDINQIKHPPGWLRGDDRGGHALP